MVSPFTTATRYVPHDGRELAPAAIGGKTRRYVRDRDPLLHKATMLTEHEYRYPDLRLQRYAEEWRLSRGGKLPHHGNQVCFSSEDS